MSSTAPIPFINATGARSPLGLSALQIAMCARAKKAEPRSTRLRDKRDREIGACLTPGLPEDLYGYERLLAIAAPALREAALGADFGGRPLPMALALPEPGRPDDHARLHREILADLAAASGVAIEMDRSVVVRAGHAAGALALEAALGMLSAGAQWAIWGGADSYFHPETLRWLDEECRLHALDAENGFVPSEGAAFMILSRAGTRLSGGQSNTAGNARNTVQLPVAAVRFAQSEREETVATGEPNVGRAMTQLLRRAAESTREGVIRWALNDINGERHRIREWTLAAARGSLGEGVIEGRLVEDLGDMGAAIGPMLGSIACSLWRAGCAPASSATVALCSEGAERGVFVLEEATL
ncbi:MAG TPA: beta-ketoacyl synthase N-terminal-like domain-containing protein [Polyangiaceae bacterium]|jgi:3-oxoacyl-[acyl-carrier-protein] synthase-1|nr:beta-ketoacyl synthase N-terminal-like domain-containing protein [Polyangiaceae bacterium]